MSLKIFNTMSGKKENFVPKKENQVRMYVCGVTVYDYCHVGHARSAIVFDTLTAFVANANGDPYDTSDDADTDVAAYALVDPSIIEPFFDPLEGPSLAPVPAVGDGAITEYWAVFGYNGTDPFREGRMDLLNDEETDAGDGIDFGGQPGDAAW